MKIVGFITIRGGSKGIPKKNIKTFYGKPLVYWVIKAANDGKLIDRVVVSTDNDQLKQVVQHFSFSKVDVIKRSEHSATDDAQTELAMLEFAHAYDFQYIILIQATSPLLETNDLLGGINQYLSTNVDSLVSVVRQKRFVWEDHLTDASHPVNYDPLHRPRRQNWSGFLVENGAFYITSKKQLTESHCRISGKTGVYEMPEDTYYEIDEPGDWLIVEHLKKQRERKLNHLNAKLGPINLLICDIDGVLTDAGMYYSAHGDELKKFHTRDGLGIERLKKIGVEIMFLTGERNRLIEDRAKKLEIDYVFMGIKNKKLLLDHFFKQNDVHRFSTSAYIGDDINDLSAMRHCSFSATPQDAYDQMKHVAHYICLANGGQGCVREVCDLIIEQRLPINHVVEKRC